MQRCLWCGDDPLYIEYHDQEWGVPLYEDQTLFAFLILEGMQAGLSWITILRKRENIRRAFADFNPNKLVCFHSSQINQLMQDPGIIRSERKIQAVLGNARAYLALKEQGISLADFLWQFTDHKVVTNHWSCPEEVPVSTRESQIMAKALKKAGFSFVGEKICYAFMQAVGMVNDHLVSCFRHQALMEYVNEIKNPSD